MKSTTLFTAAIALFSSALASPVNSGSKSIRSTAGFQSVEALLESNNAFSDEVAVIGNVKLLIESSESILKDIDARLKRMGVDKHAIRHRSLNQYQPQPSGDNTGKLVPVAQTVEKIQKGIKGLTEIASKIECPQSLPMPDYTRCVAAQEDPLRQLREYYPDSMNWDSNDSHGPLSDPPNDNLDGPSHSPSHGSSSHGGPPNGCTVCSAGGCASAANTTAKALESIHSTTTSTSTIVIVASTTNPIASVCQSPASTHSCYSYPSFAGKCSTSSSVEDVGCMTSTSSSCTSVATVTACPTNTVTSTLTTETTIATTNTVEFAVTNTIEVTSTISVASVMYPDTVTVCTASSSPSPSPDIVSILSDADGTSSETDNISSDNDSSSSDPDSTSSDTDSTASDTSNRTVWIPKTQSPYLYATTTPPVPAAPMPSSSSQSSSSQSSSSPSSSSPSSSPSSSSQSTPTLPWTVYQTGNATFPTSYRIHMGSQPSMSTSTVRR
ncbi:hypothetical protein Vi05172_g7522 [Venturia inaequalis]|nr:hypothetical protein Vi05172_g7522 [Venturia inaequalis]